MVRTVRGTSGVEKGLRLFKVVHCYDANFAQAGEVAEAGGAEAGRLVQNEQAEVYRAGVNW
jgi:hypothetical protein